jgi:hypothetical protein
MFAAIEQPCDLIQIPSDGTHFGNAALECLEFLGW